MLRFVLFALCLTAVLAWKPTSCGFINMTTKWTHQVNPNFALPDFPRPQMIRGDRTWKNLNGLWEWEKCAHNAKPPFGKKLTGEILVPYPLESCLSGVGANHIDSFYRLVFDKPATFGLPKTLLHFGAVDWETHVYLNGVSMGSHQGGYDGFSFDISSVLRATGNELIVYVYDPSDLGHQVNGKQRLSAMIDPSGDTYFPITGIWQTVWVENVADTYITSLRILPDLQSVTVTVNTNSPTTVTLTALERGSQVATISGNTETPINLVIPKPKLWHPDSPFLYDLKITLATGDEVMSYFGLRTFRLEREMNPGHPAVVDEGVDRPFGDMSGMPVELSTDDYKLCAKMCDDTKGCAAWAYAIPNCDLLYKKPTCWLKSSIPGRDTNKCRVSGIPAMPPHEVVRPHLNGEFLFGIGWLDQSYWPDGLYTAPTDEALLFDLQAIKDYGYNMVRLHQKVNPERWYWFADRMGILVIQDMPQKYGGATNDTVALFMDDLKHMMDGPVYNHPCVIQWTVFNEGDCYAAFDVSSVVRQVMVADPSRLVDTDSGGGANDLHIADVDDLHNYAGPDPFAYPTITQYSMVGEFGGLGVFITGKQWAPGKCWTYKKVATVPDLMTDYLAMVAKMKAAKQDLSIAIFTQITDVEAECDGWYNYDRTNKLSDAQMKQIAAAHYDLIHATP